VVDEQIEAVPEVAPPPRDPNVAPEAYAQAAGRFAVDARGDRSFADGCVIGCPLDEVVGFLAARLQSGPALGGRFLSGARREWRQGFKRRACPKNSSTRRMTLCRAAGTSP
jgi:hypothetical protein